MIAEVGNDLVTLTVFDKVDPLSDGVVKIGVEVFGCVIVVEVGFDGVNVVVVVLKLKVNEDVSE